LLSFKQYNEEKNRKENKERKKKKKEKKKKEKKKEKRKKEKKKDSEKKEEKEHWKNNFYECFFPENNDINDHLVKNELNNETSLTLFGRDTQNWATYWNNNVLHLLENFYCDYPPQGYSSLGNSQNCAIEGQLWFDSYNNQLKICVSENQFDDFALPIGATWKKVKVIRQKIRPALPLVVSEIYVPVVYSRIEAYLGSLKVPIYALLEKITGFKITKVDQRISGCLISKSQSKYLGVKTGSAGLNIVRHYYGMQNKLLLVTNSIYRADQYTYQVSLNYDQSLSSSRA
jgi:actin-related protein